MKNILYKIFFAVVFIAFLILSVFYGFTIVKTEDVEKLAQSEMFDAVTYVDSIWDTKLIPTFTEKAVELPKILSEIQVDSSGNISKEDLILITNKYGSISVGEAHLYMVEGSGKIVSINKESSLGTIELELDGYDGPIKVLIYIGSRLPSDETSIRDAVGFISFGDFKEQTEYGKAASEINKKVLTAVLGSLDQDSLQVGTEVTFEGAFTIRTFNLIQINLSKISIVPVKIQLKN